jgi:ribosomal protein L37AE/L43A
MRINRGRAFAVIGFLALAVTVWSIADMLFHAQHPCEKCGAEMQQFENASTIYKCQKCGFMLDTGFQR